MYTIDRFEGEIALLEQEDRKMIEVPRHLLPHGAKEGDCLQFDGKTYVLDEEGTQKQKERIKRKMDALWN
ncbi:MAG: DUF3006 domain-containing protein [Oscillospiraceae bacterium]|nr:DUF3006 domain-containing protein [Oscillospiraceae bacterium]